MKKFFKTLFQIVFALLLLGMGIKFLMHFLGKLEDEDEDHREPYQPEEE